MESNRPVGTPLAPGTKLIKATKNDPQDPLFNYRRAVGLLNYLVLCCRLDLAFAASALSQFLNDPSSKHIATFKHVLR